MKLGLQVIEFKADHADVREWDSLADCASCHHCSVERIKKLIFSGDSLDSCFFDIPLESEKNIIQQNGKLLIVSDRVDRKEYDLDVIEIINRFKKKQDHCIRHGELHIIHSGYEYIV